MIAEGERMLSTNLIISSIAIVILTILAGFVIARKLDFPSKDFRKLIFAGAFTFIAAQVLHIPVVQGFTFAFSIKIFPSLSDPIKLIINAIVLGLLAGIFEETARYLLFKRFLKSARTWNDGLVVGFGHGGIEAILVGVFSVITLVNMIAFRNADLASMGIPADQIVLATEQINTFWSTPVYMPFIGIIERVSAIALHISLSIFVLYGVLVNQSRWFWFALLWHSFVNAVAVYWFSQINNSLWGIVGLEVVVAGLAGIAMYYAVKLRIKIKEES